MSVQDDSMEQIDVIEEEIDSDVICEQKIESFKSLINNEFCNFVVANWEDKSVQKCFDALAGKVASSVKGGVEKFKWYCYGFGHELSAKQKSGKKKKNGKSIPVQATAISRHTYRHRSSNLTQFIITENDDSATYHSQPVPNKRTKRAGHNLAADVASNRP